MTGSRTDADPLREIPRCRTWLHLRILYSLVTLLALTSVCSLWLCFRELGHLRRDFEGKIVTRGVADFIGRPAKGKVLQFHTKKDGTADSADSSQSINYGDSYDYDSLDTESVDTVSEFNYSESEEQLLRVKRRATRAVQPPSLIFDSDSPAELSGEGPIEGSPGDDGKGGEDGSVWITSYSRIPVSNETNCCLEYHPQIS